MDIYAIELKIPFRQSFKHTKAERKQTQSIFVTVQRDRHMGIGEACPRPYVTGETIQSCLKWIKDNRASIADRCHHLTGLKDWIYYNRNRIARNPSAWCAVELALLDLFAVEENASVEELLGLKASEGVYQYTAVVGNCQKNEFKKVVERYAAFGFWDYKLKISGHADMDNARIHSIAGSAKNARIRLDANNLWASDYKKAEAYLDKMESNVFAIEEPLDVRDFTGIERLSNEFSIPVIFDESVCNLEDMKSIAVMPENCIINVRISKMGGLLASLRLIDKIRDYGFKVIVGCMVGETSLLSRVALMAAKYSGERLVAQEGAFGDLLLVQDYVGPTIKFGEKGLLQFKEFRKTDPDWKPGWGVKPLRPI